MTMEGVTNPFSTDVFADFFEEAGFGQQAAFFSALPQNQTGVQQQFFTNQFQDVLNQFLGALGGQIRAGEDPTLTFADFTADFPFQQTFAGTSPFLRGGPSRSRFSPPARSIFF